MDVTKNELTTMTESFDIITTKARLAESEEAISKGIARLREIAIGEKPLSESMMDATLDMIQTEIKRVEMYSRALGEWKATR